MIDAKGNYRRNGKKVYIKQPEFEELRYVEKLWSDEDTMREIGGVFNFPKSKWEMFYKKMIYPTDGKNFYCLVYNTKDKAVGEASFHGYDSATKIARFNIKIHSRYRNKGYAEEATRLLLEYYFLEFGGKVIMDNISTDSGKRVAQKIGFKEVRNYKNEATVKITKEEFLESNRGKRKNVAILLYEGIDMGCYSVIHDLLIMANSINEEVLFDIHSINFKGNVIASNDVSMKVKRVDMWEKNADIIFLIHGTNIDEEIKDKEKIRYIMSNLENCDYICANGEALRFLVRCRAVDGVFIPEKQSLMIKNEGIEDNVLLQKNYVDNGKIMLSANIIGQIQLVLALIEKVGGRGLSRKVAKNIGLE